MSLQEYFGVVNLPVEISAEDRQLIEQLQQLLSELQPTLLDRQRSEIGPGPHGVVVTVNRLHDPGATIMVEACGDEVVVSYGEEHLHLRDAEPDAAQVGPLAVPGLVPKVIAFLRALVTGRIELHVSHRLLMVMTRSYWINDHGQRELFLTGGTLWPSLQWTRVPLIRTFDLVGR